MKRRIEMIGIAVWMIVALALATATSCSKTEERTIVGTWEMLDSLSEGTGEFWTFNSDNTCDIFLDGSALTGDYAIDDKALHLDLKGNSNIEYEVSSTDTADITATGDLSILKMNNKTVQLTGNFLIQGYDAYYDVPYEYIYELPDRCHFRKVK